jgi:hypothetical protein
MDKLRLETGPSCDSSRRHRGITLVEQQRFSGIDQLGPRLRVLVADPTGRRRRHDHTLSRLTRHAKQLLDKAEQLHSMRRRGVWKETG